MPCYCDIPDEDDQKEIEKRCKTNMYFDGQYLLTKEQVIECQNKNLKKFPLENINDLLCILCKILTENQMKKVSAYYYQIKWPHKTLYDWHIQHCKHDYGFNNES